MRDEKKIYFVAESKGSLSELDLRLKEKSKIDCGKKYFDELRTTLKVGKELADFLKVRFFA